MPLSVLHKDEIEEITGGKTNSLKMGAKLNSSIHVMSPLILAVSGTVLARSWLPSCCWIVCSGNGSD